jgi:hypothetical protein
MADFEPVRTDKALTEAFEHRRRGVSDPAQLIVAELHNISDALQELLKYARQIRNELRK